MNGCEDCVMVLRAGLKGLCRVHELEAENARLREALEAPLALVKRQAEDDGLWSVPAEGTQSIAEACLQAALRKLHFAIESNAHHAACDVQHTHNTREKP